MIKNIRVINKKLNKKLGFTLVEMLVVISIIGILSTVLGGGYINSQKSARDAARKLSLKSISDAINWYYSDYGYFPKTPEININNLISNEGELSKNGVIYIKKMPNEKISSKRSGISYQVSGTGRSFRLYINLENEEDKDCYKDSFGNTIRSLNGYYTVPTGCIYLVTSSNVGSEGLLL